jgi:hypothetical protein
MKLKIVSILIIILLIITVLPISGQNIKGKRNQITKTVHKVNPLDIEWDLIQGGEGFDSCYCVKQTQDEGFIFAGGSYSFGPGLSDIWIVKTDESGVIVWNNTYGGPRNESCYSIQKTLDEGFIVSGKTKVVEPDNFDAILLKIDSDGNELWNVTYGAEEYEGGWWVETTPDGGYILVGITESKGNGDGDVWIIKTNSEGVLLWDKTFGGNNFDEAEEIIVLEDGAFILIGSTESFGSGGKDLWIIKIDSNGSLLWEKVYGGKFDDEGWSIESTNDNCFFILGNTNSFGAGNQDFWLIKTDNSGNIILNRTFGGDKLDQARRIHKANDGSYLLFGCTQSFDANNGDYWLIVIDEKGQVLWEKLIGTGDFDIGYDVQQTEDLGYIFTGVTYNIKNHGDAWFVKLAPFENNQPSKPDKPDGQTKVKLNKMYNYSTVSTDLDNDEIYYQWDWGDSSNLDWDGPYESNELCKQSHSWTEKGIYQIKVRARDTYGGESEWSEPLVVTMPRNKTKFNSIILEFLYRYPSILILLHILNIY